MIIATQTLYNGDSQSSLYLEQDREEEHEGAGPMEERNELALAREGGTRRSLGQVLLSDSQACRRESPALVRVHGWV